jgi:hypothetical protein
MKIILLISLFLLCVCSISIAEITYVAFDSTANGSSSTLVIDTPAGTQNGDIMIAGIQGNGTPSITPPAGWTELYEVTQGNFSGRHWVYYKIASSEGSNHTWTFSGSVRNSGGILTFTGNDTSSPIDDSDAGAYGSMTSYTLSSITTSQANDMLVYYAGVDFGSNPSCTPPTGFTEVFESNGGSETTMGYKTQAAAGATGTFAGSTGSSSAGAWSHIAILEGAAGQKPSDFTVIIGMEFGGMVVQ